MSKKTGILILAAGASRRMGTPKQLLKIGDETLLNRTIRITQQLINKEIVVVLGANAAIIQPTIKVEKTVSVVLNEDWEKGMGTTLKKGVDFLKNKISDLEAIIILVCDQPYLTTEILTKLRTVHQKTKAEIVATKYNDVIGVPALFSKELFPKLLELNEDEGARKIIKKYHGVVETVHFPQGIIDLDTPAAYQTFLKNKEERG